jgi:HAD superfamily hydrolase (TIGR01509 family)
MLLAVAWDIDGTLVDSEPLHHRALVAGCAGWGVDVSDLPDQAFRGIHMGDVWLALRGRFPVSVSEADWLCAINDYYAANASELRAMPHAIETVRNLRRLGILQACVSNSARAIVNANLGALGIVDCLEFSLSLDDVSEGKPSPVPYAEACRRLGTLPEFTLAIEDSRTGARSAKAAGLVVAGYGPAPWDADEVNFAILSLRDVAERFAAWRRRDAGGHPR